MEPDRVEMSVGSGMVNGDRHVNGVVPNGSSINTKSQQNASTVDQPAKSGAMPYTNGEIATVKKEGDGGTQTTSSILHDAPPELLRALSSEFYLPMARLISRSAQSCWNDLSNVVERLASMPVPAQNPGSLAISSNDQTKTNLDKKDLLLNFAKEHKDIFIKLLVLLQWSRKSEQVRKTIELNLWLQQRRQAFNNATGTLGAMMRGLADSQVPNPDLYTASEVLATGGVSSMPKLGYNPQPLLTSKQILRVLRRLDAILCIRMTLAEDLLPQLQTYHIHDGRVTFTIPDEFSFDVSVASEEPEAKFGMVDFAFLFSPAPSIPDSLHDEITFISNSALDKDGFGGVYDFLHDLTLSYKLNEFIKQARGLAHGLWNGHLRVEVLRRTLIVQYWLKSSVSKSWLEIGIHSGRKQDLQNATPGTSGLRLRWLREGKLTDNSDVHIDLSDLSFENVLRQVIAQHTNYLFDAVYDKLVASPLYDEGTLELNQTTSTVDPTECVLEVQLSKTDTLNVSMEPIGGSLILSPVSERISRLQYDLTRSKNLVDEFVARSFSLRSSTADSNLIRSLPNSRWQRLEGIKVNLRDAEKLFGMAITRVSCLRLPEWAQEWMLTIAQSPNGDTWWLTQSIQPNSIVGSRTTVIVENHPLYMVGTPSPAYLERLATYTTGAIALQCNAEYLNQRKITWRLPDIPAFDGESKLPALQFSRTSHLTSSSLVRKDSKPSLDARSFVHITYHGIERRSKKVILVAKAALIADGAVLKDLASSKLDQSVSIIPDKQQLMIKVESDAGTPVIETLISKISHLENIVACAVAVKKSTEHTLQSLSLSNITILYHTKPDLSLRIDFGNQSSDQSVSFIPAETNPHRQISQWVMKLMRRKGYNSTQRLSNVFVVLRMTLPMISYLQRIQSPTDTEAGASTPNKHLRVHTLHRSLTAYGLQYFADSSNFARDETGDGAPKKLLARFEILAVNRGGRLMWLIRPAIEEFNSYNRPSYTSKALREKLHREVFKKHSKLWVPLDGGSACPSHMPEPMMTAIHDIIVDWVKDSVKPESASEQNKVHVNSNPLDGLNEKKPARPNPSPQKAQNPPQRPNGVQKNQQSTTQQKPQNFNNRNQAPRPSEVITLD